MPRVLYNHQQYDVEFSDVEPTKVYVIKERRQGPGGLYATPTQYRQRISSQRKKRIIIQLALNGRH